MYDRDFQPAMMLVFYENLSLLIEAAYIMHTAPPDAA
jgi:hypothetical protein